MYYLLGWLTDNSTEECNAWEKMLLYLEQVMRQDARWRARLESTTFDVMTGDYIVIAVRRAASQQAGVLISLQSCDATILTLMTEPN